LLMDLLFLILWAHVYVDLTILIYDLLTVQVFDKLV